MKTERPIIDLLMKQRFPHIADALRARKPQILGEWVSLVRRVLPSADPLTFVQLRDDMPDVLEKMATALESDSPNRTEELLEVVPKHGEVRYHQSFSLAEMLIEYDLLRALVVQQVVTHLGRAIGADEVVGLNGVLDLAARKGTLAYVGHQSDQLRAAAEAQSKYLSFLSHDLRGGLNGVFLMIEVLRRELAEEPHLSGTVKDLDAMRRSLLETVGTMDRFLHAERFRKGKVELKPGRVHIKHLLNETVSNFSYQADAKGLQIRVNAQVDCAVISDRELLSLILQNLISNAVKYTPTGKIEVTARSTDEGGCLVTVADQGPGIARERLGELFSPFTRGETHGQPGVGLGLSIARQAAEYLGAKLWAESQVGRGTTFFVQVPAETPSGGASQ